MLAIRFLLTLLLLGVVCHSTGDSTARAEVRDRPIQRITPRAGDGASTKGATTGEVRKAERSSTGWTTAGGALTLIVVLILVSARVLRRTGLASANILPSDAIQVLGRKPLDFRHTMHLVRCGSRLLVLGSSPNGLTTLAQIDDPVEVDSLAGLCHASDSAAVGDRFSQLLGRFRSAPALSSDTDERDDRQRDAVKPDANPALLRLKERFAQGAPRVSLVSDPPDPSEVAG
jgi:flagellar biogenesis protein FliO